MYNSDERRKRPSAQTISSFRLQQAQVSFCCSPAIHEFCAKFDVTTAKLFPIHSDPINHKHHPIYAANQTPFHPIIHPHGHYSTQLIRCFLHIENRPLLLGSNPIILQHSAINPSILTLNLQHGLWCNGFEHKVVIAVWAVFVAFLEFFSIFSEGFFALFAGKGLNVVRGDRCGELVKEREGESTISVFWRSGWLSCSAWHSAQSNHFLPGILSEYSLWVQENRETYSKVI